MKHKEALAIAEGWVRRLEPYCERVEIAGSLRRLKGEVKDIELVAAPKVVMTSNLFGEEVMAVNYLEQVMAARREAGDFRVVEKWGRRYKRVGLVEEMALDLFIVLPPAQWGVILVLRTGPAEFSTWCVTARAKGGGLPSYAVVREGCVWEGASPVAMREEEDFFRYLGLEWQEPAERRKRW